ncbi:FAD-dependent oxidoreductase [Streptomyces sp. NPDC006879]|uniref:FAD-dependent oxidoreductase n=1 Tax=Streptomyces sp. NPDC006879 TaxID=3364767 RepID=UPI0036B7F749
MSGPTGRAETQVADVVIVGAGPTGLTLAVDLARRGVDALLVERSLGLFPGSRGKGIQPRTREVFEDLGVLDAIHSAGSPYPPGLIWRDGIPTGEHQMFDPARASEDSPYAEPWMVPQWRTQEILLARLAEIGGRVDFGREVLALTQDEQGVTVEFNNGPRGRARYVVAADGGRSTVRRLLGITMAGQTVDPMPLLVADASITGIDREHWHFFPPRGSEDGFLSICPLAGTAEFQVVAQFTEGTHVDLSLDGISEVISRRSHLLRDNVTEVRWASDFQPRAALAQRFRAGRVFLAGDAAHVHSPAGAQGLNTSVQDAYNLGWKLGAVLKDAAPDSLLDTYEEERLPNAADMLGLSTQVHRGEVRRGAATQQLTLDYRGRSLSTETRENLPKDALRAGDRAPDGILDGARLFDAFRGPHWTLLSVGGEEAVLPPLPDAVHTFRVPCYSAYGTGVFLVRPDGYVGWAGRTAAGLMPYVKRVGVR